MKMYPSLLVMLFAFSANSAPTSYPLICRGGNSKEMLFKMAGNGLNLTFIRGSKPANQGLNPGECSWTDRGVRESEPNNLWQIPNSGPVSPVVEFDGSKQVTKVLLNSVSGKHEMWFGELLKEDKYWVFEVYNSGDYLTVTKSYAQ